ncbi:Ty3/gypsy retrotransposon protein, partial [Trifolium pratense]
MARTNAERLDDLSGKVDAIIDTLATLTTRPPPPPTPTPTPTPTPPPQPLNHHHLPRMKLDVPKFDGSDAMGWIFKISQFFDYHQTPEEERLTVASFYMEGPALSWFQWMHRNGQITTWFGLLQALETRFAPSYYDDPSSSLFKLTQRTTVNEYLAEFERLANRIVGLQPPFLLSCFISGLSPEIRREVQALRPMSLTQATALAKLQEDKIADRRRFFKNKPNSQQISSSSNPFGPPPSTPPLPTPNTLPLLPPPKPNRPNFRKLSPEEMASRREKGLCYNCDETFTPQHKCRGRFFLLVTEEPMESPPDLIDFTEPDPPNETTPTDAAIDAQISLHALSGCTVASTIRLMGCIANHPVTVLIDGGSTHNFVQDRIAKFLELPSIPISNLKVMVGNGNNLDCTRFCSDVPLMLQSKSFVVDFYVLPLCGADIVLGAPWLKNIGPVLMDYSSLSLSFTHQGQPITLTADPQAQPKPVSAQQVKRLLQTNSTAELFHIQILNPTPDPPTIEPPQPHPIPSIQSLLLRFSTIFNSPTTLPPPRPIDHHITLQPNSKPVNTRPYRYPYFQKNEIEHQIQTMLSAQLIQHSQSPFSSPVLLVKKKDGGWRFCVDYRALNSITIRDRFPMPTIDELLDELGSATWFSKLDLRQGFHQIRMHPDDIPKTAFRTHQGHYEFRVMPFGLCNAPSTFQAAMNNLLQPFLRKFVTVFFDDILVYSMSLEDHLKHLESVFQALIQGEFFLKQSKCLLAQRRLEYLGHVVSAGGVCPEPSKIQAILDWPLPTNITALRGFLGLTGFYRKFIQRYASIASPLTSLLRKDSFHWNPEATIAFNALKLAMTSAPTLALPDFSKPFILETDASGIAMGAVLMQDSHPIAFFSKPFCQRLQKASTYVRELHAITTAVKKWRQYLLGHKFIIFTDHQSLKELLTQIIQTPEQQIYLAKLMGYDYTIQYKTGKTNVVADALSRLPETPSGMHLSLSMPNFLFLEQLKLALAASTPFTSLFNQISQTPSQFPKYKIHQGLILYDNRIWLDPSLPFCKTLLEEFHSSPSAGHMGFAKTLARLQANFWWEGMRNHVKEFITNCSICQQVKYETKKPSGLLQPLPIPHAIWEDLSLDFITGLPPSNGYSAVLVVVDRFSKGVHLAALVPHYTAHKVALLFFDTVCKIHGMPRSLVSDRDPLFISKFWRELFTLCGTTLRMSTAYHPETDGQTEVYNRVLEQYLRSFVHHKPSQWSKFLALAEWSYNTSIHSSTGHSPYEITFGKPPPSVPQYIQGQSSIEAVDSILANRQQLIITLRQKLLKSQAAMKHSADQHRRDIEFDVGSFVYVRLRPYRQKTANPTTYTKLSKRYYGPFKVIKRIGKVAYHLDLPLTCKIHPVFHCSLLKLHHGPTPSVTTIPPLSIDHHPIVTPLTILDTKLDSSTDPPTKLALVQWSGLPTEDTSWENWDSLCSDYHLEDKVSFPAAGDVSKSPSTSILDRPKRTINKPKK